MMKNVWFIVVAVVLIVVTGIMLLRFTSSQGKKDPYMGEDAAQFATGSDSRYYR